MIRIYSDNDLYVIRIIISMYIFDNIYRNNTITIGFFIPVISDMYAILIIHCIQYCYLFIYTDISYTEYFLYVIYR